MSAPVPPRRGRTSRPRPDGVTIEDVARAAGVSVATVSRALRGLPNVAPATRTRVERVATELHYEVDRRASRLATGRNDTVGLAVPNIDSWYFSQVASGAEHVLAGEGLDVLLYSVANAHGRARLLAGPSAIRRRLDGLVLIDVLLSSDETAILAAQSALRVVTVGQRTDVFPSVTVDDRAAAAMLTRHLLNLGHRRIGLVGGSDDGPLPFDAPSDRRRGYLDALAEAGIEHRPDLEVPGRFCAAGGAEAMARLMATADHPTAVVACSDEMAMGGLKTLRDLGLRVPGDVSVVGFDDHDLADVFDLTTIHQDPVWQGEAAARLFMGLTDVPHGETRHVVGATRLVVRGTSGPAPGGPRTARRR